MTKIITLLLLSLTFALQAHAATAMDETKESQFTLTNNPDLNTKSAQLKTPVGIYEYLRNNADYTMYQGARSGSINSFLSLRGNDVDLSATLIAMLRSQGYPSRFAVGTVGMSSTKVMNWLQVENADLAASMMKDQGIQNVTISADKASINFEHVWVEALIPRDSHRGTKTSTTSCVTTPANCNWVPLDPSFKQYNYQKTTLDPYTALSFDYTAYYNAIKNNDTARRDKNPLEIYQEQIAAWLQTNASGKTLDDISDFKGISVEKNDILPTSSPFLMVNTPRRYNSIVDHDAAVPATEAKLWKKTVNVAVYSNSSIAANITSFYYIFNQIDLATNRLTLTTEQTGTKLDMVLRLNGVEQARPLSLDTTVSPSATAEPFTITMYADGAPAITAGAQDEKLSVSYSGAVGGYYLIATGGEQSNFSQANRAAKKLLAANQQYKIVFNPADPGANGQSCDTLTHTNCTPYIDVNSNGIYDVTDTKLIDNKPAMDALTGGLLDVAGTQYFAKFKDTIAKLDKLNKVKTPSSGFIGLVSSVYEIEYIDGTAFSILPGGLLIDIKGVKLNGSWRIDQAASHSNLQFDLILHSGSSLEHEVWQELTGYDAISTVRGIQMSLASDSTTKLLNPKRNSSIDTLPSMYADFGYSTAAPSGFTKNSYTLYGNTYYAWSNPDTSASFYMFSPNTQGILDINDLRLPYVNYQASNNVDNNLRGFRDLYNLYTSGTLISGTLTCGGQTYANQPPSFLLSKLQICFNGYLASNTVYFALTNPNTTLEFRVIPPAGTPPALQTTPKVTSIRDGVNRRDLNVEWYEYIVPSKLTIGSNYRFHVSIAKRYDPLTNNETQAYYMIDNMNNIAAGGGYVDGTYVLTPANSVSVGAAVSAVIPTFNNATLNSKNTIGESNNNTIRTPSTADPVSTVTGNNYHDETDVVIKGRGLNMVFTRTYNSAPSSTKLDIGLGFGWTHSYAMRLKSNDYGNCPDCSTAQDAQNANNKTASITYTDERGGDHNYLVNESNQAVTSPAGEFDSLVFNTPSSGLHTMTFRSGVKYIFEGASNISTAISVTARLKQIVDPYGNQLNFTYDATAFPSKLVGVADNLAIAGRTGLSLTYDATNHLQKVTDWSGRNWNYVVDASKNLASMRNALNQTISYTYPTGTHHLNQILMPLQRDGKTVQTAFKYYQNGKTFNYANVLGETETLDYDLYRKTTRVTDPRGGIRTYEYDQSGRMTKLIEPDGGTLFFSNNPDGIRYKKTDALGYLTQYSYKADKTFNTASDSFGNVTREQDPLLQNVDTTYGIYDQVATMKNKRGTIKTNAYYTTTSGCGFIGKLQSVTLSTLTVNGVVSNNVLLEDYCWNTDGTLKTRNEYIDAGNTTRKRTSKYTYTAGSNGLNLSQIAMTGTTTSAGSPASITKTFVYDNLGRKTSETLQRRTSATNAALINITTSYEYDALNRVTAVIDNLGNRMETVYDANGQVYQQIAKYKQSNGSFIVRTLSTRTYDAADRMLTDTDVEDHTTQYRYDAAGNVTDTLDANDHLTSYEYDEMNRRTAIIDANGSRTITSYDQAGHILAVTNANNQRVSNTLDKLGRALSTSDAKGYTNTYSYDANNNLICTVDANAQASLQPKNTDGCTVSTVYDELNRPVQSKDALGGITKMRYNLLGNVTHITDASNKLTQNNYDDLGRLISVTDPLIETPTDKVDSYTYDEAGNVLTYTNRLGQVTRSTYDGLNRLTKTEYLTDATSDNITYDTLGDATSISNNGVTYSMVYDTQHRLATKTDSRQNKTLDFFYDPVGNLQFKIDYQGNVTEYRYDSTNQLVSLNNPTYLTANYQHDAAGRLLTRTLSDGAQTSTTYDANGWPLSLVQKSANGTVLSNTTYTRDRLGNILTQSNTAGANTGTTTFTYDALYRLKTADYPAIGTGSATVNDEAFTYDAVGNRLTQTKGGLSIGAAGSSTRYYEYTANSNRLKAIHTGSLTGTIEKSYTYDDAGRLTAQTGIGAKTLTWNQQDRAKTINASSKAITYRYDPLGYRISSTGSSRGNQDYYLEGEHLEALYSNNLLQAQYLRGASTDELLAGWLQDSSNPANIPADANTGVSVNTITGTPYIFHHDSQNSVSAISSHDGTMLQQASYSAFGNSLNQTGSAVNNSNTNTLKYTGREQDADTGLYYYRARYNDTDIGRFISEDPLGFQAGINFYAYVGNNPVNANDPSGLAEFNFIGTSNQQAHLQNAYNRFAATPTGGQYAQKIDKAYDVVNITLNDSKDAESGFQPPSVLNEIQSYFGWNVANVTVASTGGRLGLFSDSSGNMILRNHNLQEIINHEMPHVAGTLDNGAYHMNTVNIQNQIATEMGIPYQRLTYSAPTIAQMNESAWGSVANFNAAPNSQKTAFYNLYLNHPPSSGTNLAAAAGGFLLYPNKPNNNQMQSVYSK